jgi:hypothetical protein
VELRQNMHRATTRPMAWGAAILVPLAIGLMAWNVLTTSTPSKGTTVHTTPAITAYPLLDRNAERQPAPLLDRNAERQPAPLLDRNAERPETS